MPRAALLAGVGLLALHPAAWLAGTWLDPSYESDGLLVAGAAAALVAWSLSSPVRPGAGPDRGRLLGLLVATALIRAAAQLLGINVLGALTLVVDIYTLALWAGLPGRVRPLSALWLAALFALSLPLERILQRVVGYGLQQASARGACALLSLGPDTVRCDGVRILLAGRDVLVDLPCSGAAGLVTLAILFAACAALARPSPRQAVLGLTVALAAALAGNVVRITALSLGLAYPDRVGIDVMAAPWHEAIGLAALALAALPVLAWARRVRRLAGRPAVPKPVRLSPTRAAAVRPAFALSFLLAAGGILLLPARPVDVTRRAEPAVLPASIDGRSARPDPLSDRERAYFTRYGGSAARAVYGDAALLVVRTSAPLRHLHAPDECLRGAGHAVRHVATEHGGLPTAVYRSVDPDGRAWRIAVTFVSDRGARTASVAEAVWSWLADRGGSWTMVQRITPWTLPPAEGAAWDEAALRALDLAPAPVAALSTLNPQGG